MVTIKRGFSVKDVNNYKIVTEKKTQEKTAKGLSAKLKKLNIKTRSL